MDWALSFLPPLAEWPAWLLAVVAYFTAVADDRLQVLAWAIVVGMVLYRIRGGWLGRYIPGGTLPARLIWCIPTGLLCWWLNPSSSGLIVAFTVALLDYLGLMVPHGRQMDMGRENGTLNDDAWHMVAIGTLRVLLLFVGATLGDTSIDPLVLAGIALTGAGHALVYHIAWHLPVPTQWTIATPMNPRDPNSQKSADQYPIDHPCAWGELFWGGVQYGALVLLLPRFSIIPEIRRLLPAW